MRRTFVRTLVVTAVLQFAITRRLAGEVLEEGRAERLWALYPMNVLVNAFAWTLLISLVNSGMRVVRRS